MELTYSPDAGHFPHDAPAVRRGAGAPASTDARRGQEAVAATAVATPVRPDGGSHAVGVGVVVAVHLVVGYALISGLAQRVVDAVRQPVDVHLIEEIKPPPPPPPKPVVKIAAKVAPPPPVYVPPPVVQVATPAPPVVAVVTQQPQADVKPVPTPAVAPPAPPLKAEPVSIALVCPTMVKPELPRRAEQEGLGGSVRAQATIRGGKVVQVEILSSKPRGLFDASVRAAMLQYGCQGSGADEIVATQNFEFRAP